MRQFAVVVLTLLALFIGGCGAVLSLLAIEDEYAAAIWVFSLPSLGVGVLFGLWARSLYKRGAAPGKMPETTSHVVGKVGFHYRGQSVGVNNDSYFFDGRNFESVVAVKAHIDSLSNEP